VTNAEAGNQWYRGLQAERTVLAWTRTSLALLANGVLLLVKDFRLSHGPVPVVLAGFAAAIALSAYFVGVQRQRTLGLRPLPPRITPRRQVHMLGILVPVLILVIALALPI
jgi:uncharacterized membrane protein YidH (DUF202 family)